MRCSSVQKQAHTPCFPPLQVFFIWLLAGDDARVSARSEEQGAKRQSWQNTAAAGRKESKSVHAGINCAERFLL
jgi:hypothetical protein